MISNIVFMIGKFIESIKLKRTFYILNEESIDDIWIFTKEYIKSLNISIEECMDFTTMG